MKAYKLFVIDEEESRKVQEKAFRMGISWYIGGFNVRHTDSPFLFIEKNIAYKGDVDHFRGCESQYITVTDFLALPEKGGIPSPHDSGRAGEISK